jgi:hypothetical protein
MAAENTWIGEADSASTFISITQSSDKPMIEWIVSKTIRFLGYLSIER